MSKVIKFDSFNGSEKVNERIEPNAPTFELSFETDVDFRVLLPEELCYDKYGKTDQLVSSNMMSDQKAALSEYLSVYLDIFNQNRISDIYEASGDYYEHGSSGCFVDYKITLYSQDDMRNLVAAIDELEKL